MTGSERAEHPISDPFIAGIMAMIASSLKPLKLDEQLPEESVSKRRVILDDEDNKDDQNRDVNVEKQIKPIPGYSTSFAYNCVL